MVGWKEVENYGKYRAVEHPLRLVNTTHVKYNSDLKKIKNGVTGVEISTERFIEIKETLEQLGISLYNISINNDKTFIPHNDVKLLYKLIIKSYFFLFRYEMVSHPQRR